jgi:large subunit ribosomal protein L5
MNRLQERYNKEIAPKLREEFSYKNVHQIPRLTKVVINVGMGRATVDSKYLDTVSETIRKVTGQQPVSTVATKSIAGFKLREGNKIGAMVTLRGDRMYEFVDRLVAVTLPRIRDFRGISATAFDPSGNYSLGIREQSIFPEIPYDEVGEVHGLQVNIVTSAENAAEGKRLLELMGFPFRRNE